MLKHKNWLVLVLLVLFLSACSKEKEKSAKVLKEQPTNIPIDNDLSKRLAEFAAKPRVKGKFAFHVYDLTAAKSVYGCNEKESLPTASCMKLLTGVAGLHLLGTKYKYKTSVYTRGKVKDGVLMGDVSFKGGLDPQLNAPELAAFFKSIKQKGIKKIAGRFIVDLTIKDPVKSEQHWYPWDLSFSKYGLFYKGGNVVVKNLKTAMRGQGIVLADSQVVMGRVPQGSKCIYSYQRSIEDVIKRMWKNSSNTQATALLYSIGNHENPNVSPVDAGVAYLRKFLSQTLIQKDSSLTIHDGCGLCTHNRLTPVALTSVLRFGYNDSSIYKILHEQLSVSGVDGTLAREMTGQKTRGKIRAKTGTLSHPYGISSLAGYCKGANGHMLAFAIMDSEMSVLDARVLQRKLCEVLVK